MKEFPENDTEFLNKKTLSSMQKLVLILTAALMCWTVVTAFVRIPDRLTACEKLGEMNATRLTAVELKNSDVREQFAIISTKLEVVISSVNQIQLEQKNARK